MAKKTVKVKKSIRNGRVVKAHTRTISRVDFMNTTKVTHPWSKTRWDSDGEPLIDITATNPDIDFKFVHKNARQSDYLPHGDRILPKSQIKEVLYKKHFKNGKLIKAK
jgi:hypothetical protein